MPATFPRPLLLQATPFEVAAKWRHLPDLVFFDTAAGQDTGEHFSIVAAAPRVIVSGRTDQDWQRLARQVQRWSMQNCRDDGIPNGFAAGSIAYDGSFRFGIYPDLLVFRHADNSWRAIGDCLPETDFAAGGTPTVGRTRPEFVAEMSKDDFCSMVRRAQEHIAAGDIYQVNLAQRFTARWGGDPFAFYEALRHYSPAPYAAFLQSGPRAILSSSPELFLQLSGRHIRTRPIKGTRPRRADSLADEKSAYDLITSPKEIAELVMITDLERNDLGIVCEYGSVTVTELLKMERFEQVFHLVSTVEGRLRPEIDHVTALRCCFPGGSITGAPKKRAREIIGELEPLPRGLYTGAIGYFGFNGESQFSIAIRTVIAERGLLHFHAGAGIVADSVPEREYDETLHKAAGILLAAERMEESYRAARELLAET